MEYCISEDFKNCLLYEELFEYELIFWHGSSGWRSTALLLRIIGDPLPITFPLLVVRLESFSLPFKVWVSIMASKRLRFPSEWFDWKFISETLLIDIMYCWRLYWAFLKVRLILLIKKNGYTTIFSSMNFYYYTKKYFKNFDSQNSPEVKQKQNDKWNDIHCYKVHPINIHGYVQRISS